jgi:hypothetical protein
MRSIGLYMVEQVRRSAHAHLSYPMMSRTTSFVLNLESRSSEAAESEMRQFVLASESVSLCVVRSILSAHVGFIVNFL